MCIRDSQSDVPAVPEIGDGSGEIRAFEILIQMYAEALGSAHDPVSYTHLQK